MTAPRRGREAEELRIGIEECIHVPQTGKLEQHNARHIDKPKDSCGWCCYLHEKERADKLSERLRLLGDGEP